MARAPLLKLGREDLRKGFLSLRNSRQVAQLLEVSYQHLAYYLARGSAGHYKTFTIPKRGGGARGITAPVTALKLLQQKLNEVLRAVYVPRPSAFGFVEARNIVGNARLHQGRRWVLNVDLEDFFPSIHCGRVRGLFEARPYAHPRDVATTLARICCYQSALPQGAPTSPIVSNMICSKLDRQLQQIAGNYRCTYSRYADDITISTSYRDFPEDLARLRKYPAVPELEIGKTLRDVIEANGFRINERKTRLRPWYRRQEVTGLTVNQVPNVRRGYVKQLRSMLHAWRKFGYHEAEAVFRGEYAKAHDVREEPPSLRRVVEGKLHFLSMVRGKANRTYRALRTDFAALAGKAPFDALWVVETPESQGTAFMLDGVGLVTCAHVLEGSPIEVFRCTAPDRRFEARVRVEHRDADLAVLDVDVPPVHSLVRGDPGRVDIGASVMILGFPKYARGHRPSVASAAVIGVHELLGISRFQVSQPILGGGSGGPVLDDSGQVLGIAVTGWDAADAPKDVRWAAISVAELARLGV